MSKYWVTIFKAGNDAVVLNRDSRFRKIKLRVGSLFEEMIFTISAKAALVLRVEDQEPGSEESVLIIRSGRNIVVRNLDTRNHNVTLKVGMLPKKIEFLAVAGTDTLLWIEDQEACPEMPPRKPAKTKSKR